MSSSTSSSSASRPVRPIFARILVFTLVGMGVSLCLVRGFAMLNDASGETILQRVMEAQAALPQITAEEDDLVMVFGSSMVHQGFAARHFDRYLEEQGVDGVKSFNFGFGGLNPYFQEYLARRIRDAFDEDDRRLKVAVLELNPFQNTTARWQGAQPVVDSYLAILASPEELWEIALRDPERGAQLANIHYLRDDISAEMITWYFGRGLQQPPPRSDLPEDEEKEARLEEVGEQLSAKFEEEYPDFTGEDWYYPWQGAGTIASERSDETREIFVEYFDLLRQPRRMEDDRLRRIACCDIEELHFEEVLVEASIQTVEIFQSFSDHVEVVLLPRNTDWIRYSPEAQARLDALIARIESETGVTVRDYQDVDGITPAMFSDTTHLARYSGDESFTELLADEVAPLLAGVE